MMHDMMNSVGGMMWGTGFVGLLVMPTEISALIAEQC